jgi:hypothetical protein
MVRVAHGIRWEAQADDTIDPRPVARELDIREPGGNICGELSPEAVLWSGEKLGTVARLSEGRNQGSGNDSMPSFHEEYIRGHYGDPHGNFPWFRGQETEARLLPRTTLRHFRLLQK